LCCRHCRCAELIRIGAAVAARHAQGNLSGENSTPTNANTNSPNIAKGFNYQEGPLGMKFVKVPKGTFWMGWSSDNPQSKQMTIDRDFELAAHTVTQEQWQAVMGNNPSWFSRQGGGKHMILDVSDEDLKRFPVVNVSWDMVQEFLAKLNQQEKGRGWTYLLPNEAEWEYACRGAATSQEECSFDFYLNRPSYDLSWDQANFYSENPGGKGVAGKSIGRTKKVGSYAPNKLGLFDMHGNVWQWCSDVFRASPNRVFRGGSWHYGGQGCRAADRGGFAQWNGSNFLGFRLSRVPSL
jgi:formylglycine-generating enzyme required for sulfatase activity